MFKLTQCLIIYLISPCLLYCSPVGNKISRSVDNKIKIVNVVVNNYLHKDFERIVEYFNGGHEYCGNKCIVRDDSVNRGGLYFVVNFNKPLVILPQDIVVNIYLMIGKALEYEKYTFNLPNKRPNFVSEVYLGITSKQINKSDINAWKIELLDDNNNQIVVYKSYMWPQGY